MPSRAARDLGDRVAVARRGLAQSGVPAVDGHLSGSPCAVAGGTSPAGPLVRVRVVDVEAVQPPGRAVAPERGGVGIDPGALQQPRQLRRMLVAQLLLGAVGA